MTYASQQNLIDRCGDVELRQIADHDRDGLPDLAVVTAALVDADNLINGYVAAKYTTPLANTPDLVRTWAVSIARYVLHRNGAPDHVTADYKDAVAGLKDVARGLVMLPGLGGDLPSVAGNGAAMADIPAAHFGSLRGWQC